MRVNGEAIYGTRARAPYAEGKIRLTQGRGGGLRHLPPEAGETELPSAIFLSSLQPAPAPRLLCWAPT